MPPRSKTFYHCHEIFRTGIKDLVPPILLELHLVIFQIRNERLLTELVWVVVDAGIHATNGTHHGSLSFHGKAVALNLFPKPGRSFFVCLKSSENVRVAITLVYRDSGIQVQQRPCFLGPLTKTKLVVQVITSKVLRYNHVGTWNAFAHVVKDTTLGNMIDSRRNSKGLVCGFGREFFLHPVHALWNPWMLFFGEVLEGCLLGR
mmetsp:Transcript_28886/g.78239  ORF Transcript_28886/g.78239 Transcript_28886/m.78239 type:complete len:204 (+) Transcript_28886:234-845(+)